MSSQQSQTSNAASTKQPPATSFIPGSTTEWDAVATKYNTWSDSTTGPHSLWMLDRILESFDASKRLSMLDLACGDGLLALAAAVRTDRFSNIIASDYSASMCALVEKRVQELQTKHSKESNGGALVPLQTLIADAQDLSSIPSNSVDVCTLGFGIRLIPDPRRAAAEIKRVLKPGGVVAIASWDPLACQVFGFMYRIVNHVKIRHAQQKGEAPPNTNEEQPGQASMAKSPYSTMSEFEALIAEQQLKPLLVTSYSAQTPPYANAAAYWDALVGSLPHHQPPPAVTPTDVAQQREWACEYVHRLWGRDSPFSLSSVAFILIAQKENSEA